jgi:hypothetical protein
MTNEPNSDINEADGNPEDQEIEALFVQTAGGMTYADGVLTLSGMAPTTLLFSDRPDRVTGHLAAQDFFDSWAVGEDSFADNSPNAVLSIFTETEIIDVVVVLQDPTLDGDQMTYSVAIQDGDMPASGGANSLFIDTIGRPLSPVSVAGVHRRGRRRGRRRMRRGPGPGGPGPGR